GHTLELCRGAGLAAEIAADAPVLLEGVEALARAEVRTGAATRNWASYGGSVQLPTDLDPWRKDLLCDPQTSGGLLIAVAADDAKDLLDLLGVEGFPASRIVGSLT